MFKILEKLSLMLKFQKSNSPTLKVKDSPEANFNIARGDIYINTNTYSFSEKREAAKSIEQGFRIFFLHIFWQLKRTYWFNGC